MVNKLQAIRGMNDILPGETPLWAALEATARELLSAYGYREMRIPLVENTELFSRSIGEVTDIVEKEMYTFQDRNGDSLTLRPEATAGFVRACLEHGLLHNQTQRIWCIGPMFRYEKPQKGRYRQFHQIDVEAFGLPGPDIDAELICITARLWKHLGLDDFKLHLNSLGSNAARGVYRERLTTYFEAHREVLDEDSRRRLYRNPLRILDSKNPALAELIAQAPLLLDHLDAEARRHFEGLQALLQAAGIAFDINPRLVRGLDYYNNTVFEWTTTRLGAQSAVCGGGRYDGLVEQLGGRAVPGIGFAMGMERLVAMLASDNHSAALAPHAYLVAVGDGAEHGALALAEKLRDQIPMLRLLVNCGGGNFKSQFKRADQSGARFALIVGEDEIQRGRIAVKPLREDRPQLDLSMTELDSFLRAQLSVPRENIA